MVVVVLEALGASFAYAMASVLQQHTAAQAPRSEALRVGLLVALAASPLWLLGIVFDVGGYVLQFIALGHGSLVLVQPLLVCGLLFAMPLGAFFSHSRWLSWSEWIGSACVVAGLSLFLVVASPAPGQATTSNVAWVIVTVATVVPVAILVGGSRLTSGSLQAGLMAVAAGVAYGLAAAYTRTVAHLVTTSPGGVIHLLYAVATTWQTYALILTGAATLVLVQSAFQAGPLGWSLPALTVVDPLVSIFIGAFAFHEAIASAPEDIAFETIGFMAMIVGVALLARSPFVPQNPRTMSSSASG